MGGGPDLGNVSQIAPLGIFGWPRLGPGTSSHVWTVTACGGMSIGDRASLDTARILAGMGHDVMADAGMRDAARADLAARLADAPYLPLLPAEQKTPVRLPEGLRKSGQEEITSFSLPEG